MTNDSVGPQSPEQEKSFEELLNETLTRKERFQPGEMIATRVVGITTEWVFIDLGGKSEGYIDAREFTGDEGATTIIPGDTIKVYFLSSKNNEKLFTTKIISQEAGKTFLEDAWRNRIPVQGFVVKEIKGGFEVKLPGTTRSFCPFSQMGLRRVDNSSEYVGKRLNFVITEYRENGKSIVVSNRVLAEVEEKARKEAVKKHLSEGMKVEGTVVSILDFGVFVDIGGIQGLLPISEMGWGRVESARDILTEGQKIDVIITKLDNESDRISLSLKATMTDPWEHVEERYLAGSSHRGVVAKLMKFGAFVTLEPGIDGLIHISKLGKGKRINHPSDVVATGELIDVRVETVDKDNKRISLTRAGEEYDTDAAAEGERNDYRAYMEKSSVSMGTLGDVLKKKIKSKKMTPS
ncbi:MAG: 30S ribosomal protein S1 [Deltaproteobacteria bacterium]|nr:30S ribosomal protein S1 [Deltaproteobacteria bacterium]